MLFGRDQFQSRSASGQRRFVSLLMFAGVVAVLALGVHSYVLRTTDSDPAEPVAVEPGGLSADIRERTAPPRRPIADQEAPSPVDPLPVEEPRPVPEGKDLAAVRIVDGREISIDGLAALFHDIRTDPTWVNEPLPGARRETAGHDTVALWDELLRDPAAHRGELVYLEGSLLSADRHTSPLELAALPRGNPSGVDRYYETFLYSAQKLFMVAVWRHSGNPLEDGDTVRVRGRFLQVYKYDVIRDRKTVTASVPILVGDSLTRADRSAVASGVLEPLHAVLVVLGGLFVVVFVVVLWIFRRGESRYADRLEDERSRRGSRRAPRAFPRSFLKRRTEEEASP